MGRFLEAERQRQSRLRTSPTYFSTDARRPGDYKGAREGVLPAPRTCGRKPIPGLPTRVWRVVQSP